MLQRILAPIVEVRKEESLTAFLMFAYSFLAMTAYNAIKPLTRSKFITDLGADNLPYVLLAAGFIIGILMAGYAWLMARLPRRWALPITQVGMAAVLLVFWFLFHTSATWVSVAFYLAGLILGVLLISQFWTLANVVYDPRQAKRLFGFIGGGAPLGGIAGSALAAYAKQIGSVNLILPSAALMLLCAALVAAIIGREGIEADPVAGVKREKGVSATEAFDLLRRSNHLQIIALVISFAAVGAAIIEQQLNMAAQAAKGAGATDSITSFLATVGLWTSSIGFVIQIWLTSKIHRYLGIGFALMVLPVSLGSTAVVMLLNAALWAPGLARVLDQSLRYTVDKTTREILFLPLPADIKLKAKSFVDVTVDRAAKALGALLLLVLVKPWGLHLDWQRLSYASLAVTALWIYMALRARKGYLAAFRQSIERRDVEAADVRLSGGDLSTIETLVQEMSQPDPERVIYAIDMLESLDKRSLVTPLLLYHDSPAVRRRALRALGSVRGDIALRWLPQVRRMVGDPDAGVRAAAIVAIGAISNEDATALSRPLLEDADPRIRVTAAVALAGSASPADVDAAETALVGLASDARESGRRGRRDVAAGIRHIADPRFRRLLIPLLYDPASEVADEAMESVQAAGASDFVFVPTLVALLRRRQLKARAREVLVSYGEPVIDALAHFMRDPDEDIWVRRHIPGTLALMPTQKSVAVLVAALEEQDGFLRYKVIAALERLRRTDAPLSFPREAIERLTLKEGRSYFNYLSLHDNLFGRKQLAPDSLLAATLEQKMERTKDRVYRLLTLLYPWRDIAAAKWTLQHGDPRSRASASEYLDNVLTGQLRKFIMPALEDLPASEKVRRGNVLLRTRPRDVEETLLQLINADDQVVAAAAIEMIRDRKIWALGDDVEHVLAHRDVRDWYVFEAASWALAERRMPAERRRELWLEPLPAAELAGRLRSLPLFASVSIDELFRIAGAARQVRHQPGSVLLQEGAVPETIHLLLDGRVTAAGRESAPRTIEAPSALGFIQALQGVPMRRSMRTVDIAVTLALTAEELRTLLGDNTDLVRGLFSTLADRADPATASNLQPTGAAQELESLASDGLQAVEKILALQRVPVFSRIAVEEMRSLSDITHTVTMTAGSPLFAASGPVSLWLLLSGEVALEDHAGGPQTVAHAGDILGSLSMLSGREIGQSAHVVRGGIALRIDREDLFDLLGERPELLRQMFEGMFRMGNEAGSTLVGLGL
jgi:ATP/ADP translocase/CRP-like cAMP-binding protein/HEAT repeat protein